MRKRNLTILSCLAVSAAALMVGCGGGEGGASLASSAPSGSVVTFATDTPLCNVESFVVTITSANLVPQGGGSPAALITSTAPATVDFARLADFTNILNTASVARAGLYSQLQMTLTNPQLIVLNTSTNPPTPQTVPVTLATTTPTITINPALEVLGATTTGLLMDFDLGQSLQVSTNGQLTGTVNPQITVTATTSGTTVGEATALYGIVQNLTTSVPGGFTGSFGLAFADGAGQTLTVLANSGTVYEGDSVSSFSNLTAGTFVEVDAIVNTSGQIVAQIIDSGEPTAAATTTTQKSAFLGQITSVTRNSSGNATSFTLLVDDEVPEASGLVPLHSGVTVTVASTTHYFTNWQYLNKQAFTFGPSTLGLAQEVAVFGVLGSGSPPSMAANQVFLRPRNVRGNFTALLAAGSGGFTTTPCGDLFGGKAITVLTYSDTTFTGVSGLIGLTPTPKLDTMGVLFYEQTSGISNGGVIWTAPTWIMQAREVHQLPN